MMTETTPVGTGTGREIQAGVIILLVVLALIAACSVCALLNPGSIGRAQEQLGIQTGGESAGLECPQCPECPECPSYEGAPSSEEDCDVVNGIDGVVLPQGQHIVPPNAITTWTGGGVLYASTDNGTAHIAEGGHMWVYNTPACRDRDAAIYFPGYQWTVLP